MKIGTNMHFSKPSAAFTLIELLTAMAVLALVMVMLLQVIDGVLRSTRLHSQQMDSAAAARRALDMLALDISSGIVGESATILVSKATTPDLALLADRRGTNSADHRFLAVSYSLEENSLVRSYRSVSFQEADLLSSAIDTNGAASSAMADGILGLKIQVATHSGIHAITGVPASNYLTANYNRFSVPSGWLALITPSATFAGNLTNRAQALDVWIAAVDDQNKRLLDDTETLAAAKNSLGADPALWRSNIDSAVLPMPAKNAIQILNKTIPLP